MLSGEKEPPAQVGTVYHSVRKKQSRYPISDGSITKCGSLHEIAVSHAKLAVCSAVALPRMLALAHRWVQTYEQAAAVAVAAPGGAQAPGDAPRDAPARRVAPQLLAKAVDDRDAQEAGPQDPPQLAASNRDTGDAAGARWDDAQATRAWKGCEAEVSAPQHRPAGVGSSVGGSSVGGSSLGGSSVGSSSAGSSSADSELPTFLLRNNSTGSMRSFASQSSLTSDGGGEMNSYYRLLDVESELPMMLPMMLPT